MKKLLMIPDRYHLEADVELAKKYSLGYEYNDFFNPSVLDNKNSQPPKSLGVNYYREER